MGYSISVKFSTYAERVRMQAFMDRQNLGALMALDPQADERNLTLVDGEALGYPPAGRETLALGFNGTHIPFSAWAVCAWMARQSSHQPHGKSALYYDLERYEVLGPGETGTGKSDVLVNDRDVMVVRDPAVGGLTGLLRRRETAYKQDVQRWIDGLDARWQAELSAPAPRRPRP